MILVVARATEVAIKIFINIFVVLSGYDHSVKVSSNSEMGPGKLFLVLVNILNAKKPAPGK